MWTVVQIVTTPTGKIITGRPLLEPTTKERAERFAERCSAAEDFNANERRSYQVVEVK